MTAEHARNFNPGYGTLDFFGGWTESDLDLLAHYQFLGHRECSPGEMIDWLGIKTPIRHHGWLTVPEGGIIDIAGLPVPSDMVHAEAIEYVALLIALERALSTARPEYVAVELGASYGPWITASGVMARRAAFKRIRLTAVEANSETVPSIAEHAALNGLTAESGVCLNAIHAAIHVKDESLFFPKVNVSVDNGAQASTERREVDYRGLSIEHERVDGISLATLCANLTQIDFMHLDLQGAEERLVQDESFLETLTAKTSTFFLATQSRLIEGLALRNLSSRGWVLIRERPTTYQFNTRTADINGWTLRDGGQLWLNPRFGNKHIP